MTCKVCGREHGCDDPGHMMDEYEEIIAKLKADLAEAVAVIMEARRGLAWVTIDNMPEAGTIIKRIDKVLSKHRSTT